MYIILSCRVNSILKPNSLIGQLIIYKAFVFAFPLRHVKLHPCLNITVRVNSCNTRTQKMSNTTFLDRFRYKKTKTKKNKQKKTQTRVCLDLKYNI